MVVLDAHLVTCQLRGEWHGKTGSAPCPICQPEGRQDQRALSIGSDGARLLVYCHKGGCAFGSILLAAGLNYIAASTDHVAQREAEIRRAAYEAEQIGKAKTLWTQAKPIPGTKGEAYLRKRGITCAMPDTLRWLPDTYHGPSGRWMSAMVALVEPTMAIHRTFFEKSGQRIAKKSKMMLGPCAGGAVCLAKADGPLVVAEGIETTLSLASGLLNGPATIWASLSTSGMKSLRLPVRPGTLIVATDGDKVGREAGNALATRASALGWMATIMPAPDGCDWNDILQAGCKP